MDVSLPVISSLWPYLSLSLLHDCEVTVPGATCVTHTQGSVSLIQEVHGGRRWRPGMLDAASFLGPVSVPATLGPRRVCAPRLVTSQSSATAPASFPLVSCPPSPFRDLVLTTLTTHPGSPHNDNPTWISNSSFP